MINKLIRADYQSLIFEFRGYKVMVDFDLSLSYGVETKRLKEQVKRNIKRFPGDFMFQLTHIEKDQLVANCDRLDELRKEIKNIDKKLNEAFRYLLGRLDEVHQKKNERKPIGYRIYGGNNK